jgi:hypothetical protein
MSADVAKMDHKPVCTTSSSFHPAHLREQEPTMALYTVVTEKFKLSPFLLASDM